MKNNPDNLRLIFRTLKGIPTIDKSGVFGQKTETAIDQIERPRKVNKLPMACHPGKWLFEGQKPGEKYHNLYCEK